MTIIKTMIHKYPFLSILFITVILIRFLWIDRIPPGMQYDEIEYSLSSKTFQLMARDLSGTSFPESLLTTNTLGKVSPVPYMILAPIWIFFDLNLTNYRVVYAILNTITAGAFMLLLAQLFKKNEITYIGGILFLINPWSFFLSRHGMDGSFALLFYLLGIWLFIQKNTKIKLLSAFLFFVLGCFSYHGAKLPLIPLVATISFFKIHKEKLSGNKLLVPLLFNAGIVVVVLMFVLGGFFLSGSIIEKRSHEFVFTNSDFFSPKVNDLRTASVQSPLQSILVNKYILAGEYFLDNYSDALSPKTLFLHAEVMQFHGFFYLFEAFLLIFGFVSLFHKERKLFWLLFGILLLSPITSATSMAGLSIINRAILLLPILLIFITYGLYQLMRMSNKWFPQYLQNSLIIFVYGVSLMLFFHVYFFILPIQINGHYQTSTRILARYLSLEKKNSKQIVILTPKPQELYSGLMFYQNKKDQEFLLNTMQTFTRQFTFRMDNITITNECVSFSDEQTTYIVDREKELCFNKNSATELIVNQKDAGTDYFIRNGKSCKEYPLTRWINPHLMSDFAVEGMSEEEFCTRWISTSKL